MDNSKSRHGHPETSDSLLSALKERNLELVRKSARVVKSCRKLHKSKAKLAEMIATFKELEQKAIQRKNSLQETISQLNTAIDVADIVQIQSGLSQEEELVIGEARFNVHNARREIAEVEQELSTVITPRFIVGLANNFEIVEVDSSQNLEQNRG